MASAKVRREEGVQCVQLEHGGYLKCGTPLLNANKGEQWTASRSRLELERIKGHKMFLIQVAWNLTTIAMTTNLPRHVVYKYAFKYVHSRPHKYVERCRQRRHQRCPGQRQAPRMPHAQSRTNRPHSSVHGRPETAPSHKQYVQTRTLQQQDSLENKYGQGSTDERETSERVKQLTIHFDPALPLLLFL